MRESHSRDVRLKNPIDAKKFLLKKGPTFLAPFLAVFGCEERYGSIEFKEAKIGSNLIDCALAKGRHLSRYL